MTSGQPARQLLRGTTLAVSPLCLGGNRLGSALDEGQSFALLDEFVALGGNFVDTALAYADWVEGVERSCSERTIGRWVAARGNRADIVLATKGGHPSLHAPQAPRLDAASLRADVLASIDHLGGPLDLYHLHRDDRSRTIGELLETLEAFVAEGLVRYYAASNLRADRLLEAQGWAETNAVRGFVADQLEWSLARPGRSEVAADLTSMDDDLAAFHRASGMPVIPYASQARGYFDKVRLGRTLDDLARRYDTPANARRAEEVAEMAGRYDVASTSLVLAALCRTRPQTIPVVGCRTLDQLRRSWSAVDLHLDHEDADRLEAMLWASS